MYTGCHSRG